MNKEQLKALRIASALIKEAVGGWDDFIEKPGREPKDIMDQNYLPSDEVDVDKYELGAVEYDVLAHAENRKTRQLIGKPRTERINVNTNSLFEDCQNAADVKEAYETFWNELNPSSSEIVIVEKVTPVYK